MPSRDVTIIIVSYNSRDAITRWQDGLCRSGRPIIVVDNASPDGSAHALRETYPGIDVHAQDRNLGYGRAANVGLHACQTPYALLLNPDINATPEAIDELAEHLRTTSPGRAAIAGPATSRDAHRPDAEPTETHWVSGCAMLFDVGLIREVGLFDENIFLYSEETELCHRVRAAGYTILLCESVLFDHHVGESSGTSPEVEYLRWWHFGWSNAYRMVKHGKTTWWKNPLRKQLGNRVQGLLARDPAMRLKWRAKADGIAAYRAGIRAFDHDGHPMMSGPLRQPKTVESKTECHPHHLDT